MHAKGRCKAYTLYDTGPNGSACEKRKRKDSKLEEEGHPLLLYPDRERERERRQRRADRSETTEGHPLSRDVGSPS